MPKDYADKTLRRHHLVISMVPLISCSALVSLELIIVLAHNVDFVHCVL